MQHTQAQVRCKAVSLAPTPFSLSYMRSSLAHTTILLAQLRGRARAWPGELSAQEQKQRIDQFLKQSGARVLGRGAFATVYGVGGFAIKVVRRAESPAYLAYARYCQRARFPVLPRIHCTVRLRDFTAVLMERLLEDPRRALPMESALRMMRAGDEPMIASRVMGRRCDHLKATMAALHRIRQHHMASCWDLEARNLLFRRERGGLRMVLVDPITD